MFFFYSQVSAIFRSVISIMNGWRHKKFKCVRRPLFILIKKKNYVLS